MAGHDFGGSSNSSRPIPRWVPGAASTGYGCTTDIDWVHGKGPEVAGLGEALLMAMAGRSSVAKELSGLGQGRLAQRM